MGNRQSDLATSEEQKTETTTMDDTDQANKRQKKLPKLNEEMAAIIKIKAQELAQGGIPFHEITGEKIYAMNPTLTWIPQRCSTSMTMHINHQLKNVSKMRMDLYETDDLNYKPLDKVIHYNSTDAKNKKKDYTKYVMAAGNHEEFKRLDPANASKVDITVNDQKVPGKSVVTVKVPLLASETFDRKMEEVRSRYSNRMSDLRAALDYADRNNLGLDAVREAEAAYNKMSKARDAEMAWLTESYKNKHKSKDDKMAVTVTSFVLDKKVSSRSTDIVAQFMGGPKKCEHCVEQAEQAARTAIAAHATAVAAGGGALPVALPGDPAGDAATAALNNGDDAETATKAAVATVPWPTETDPRVLEIEFIQEDSIDKGSRM